MGVGHQLSALAVLDALWGLSSLQTSTPGWVFLLACSLAARIWSSGEVLPGALSFYIKLCSSLGTGFIGPCGKFENFRANQGKEEARQWDDNIVWQALLSGIWRGLHEESPSQEENFLETASQDPWTEKKEGEGTPRGQRGHGQWAFTQPDDGGCS